MKNRDNFNLTFYAETRLWSWYWYWLAPAVSVKVAAA